MQYRLPRQGIKSLPSTISRGIHEAIAAAYRTKGVSPEGIVASAAFKAFCFPQMEAV